MRLAWSMDGNAERNSRTSTTTFRAPSELSFFFDWFRVSKDNFKSDAFSSSKSAGWSGSEMTYNEYTYSTYFL